MIVLGRSTNALNMWLISALASLLSFLVHLLLRALFIPPFILTSLLEAGLWAPEAVTVIYSTARAESVVHIHH